LPGAVIGIGFGQTIDPHTEVDDALDARPVLMPATASSLKSRGATFIVPSVRYTPRMALPARRMPNARSKNLA
jgi:hypothetical protein